MTDNLEELKGRLYEKENKMRPLEWDYNRNQINPFKKQQFEVWLKEKEELVSQIKLLENVEEEL